MMWLVVPSGGKTSSLFSFLILISILMVTTRANKSDQEVLEEINTLKTNVDSANEKLSELENNLKERMSIFLDEKLEILIVKKLNETFENPIRRLKGLNTSVKNVQRTIDEFQVSHNNSIQELQTTHENIHNTIQDFDDFSEDSFNNITDNFNTFREIHDTSVQYILKTVEVVERCPEGFFKAPGTNQCMKVFMDNNKKLTWKEADQKCKDEGLSLAKPYSAVGLTKYLVERYGQTYYWVGAQGDGPNMKWQSEERNLLIDSHLWRPGGMPEDSCLTLFAMNKNLKDNPGKPYYPATCKDSDAFPLCELNITSVADNPRCPQSEGFFLEPRTDQCYKFFDDEKINWAQADYKCKKNGLVLAKPTEAIQLRKYIVEELGIDHGAWLGGKGDGSTMKWVRDQEELPRNNPLMYRTTHSVNGIKCISLLTYKNFLKEHPNIPFQKALCNSGSYYTLCERIP